MRTTITLPDQLVKDTLAITGTSRLSEAVSQLLDESIRRRKRLALIDDLFDHPVPHNLAKIKKQRKGRRWS